MSGKTSKWAGQRTNRHKGFTLISTPGTDTNTNAVLADSVHSGVDDLPAEPRAPFFISAPLIRAFIRHCLQELIREVTVCVVYLHPIESGAVYGIAGCFRVCSNIILDLGLGQWTRWLRLAGQRDGRCGDIR